MNDRLRPELFWMNIIQGEISNVTSLLGNHSSHDSIPSSKISDLRFKESVGTELLSNYLNLTTSNNQFTACSSIILQEFEKLRLDLGSISSIQCN